jgi:hypothetical protein
MDTRGSWIERNGTEADMTRTRKSDGRRPMVLPAADSARSSIASCWLSSPFTSVCEDVGGAANLCTPRDALLVLNYVTAHGGSTYDSDILYDVNGDKLCTLHDVLLVINFITALSVSRNESPRILKTKPRMPGVDRDQLPISAEAWPQRDNGSGCCGLSHVSAIQVGNSTYDSDIFYDMSGDKLCTPYGELVNRVQTDGSCCGGFRASRCCGRTRSIRMTSTTRAG